MIIFDNFLIVGADNQTYTGVRPGLVPKPFKYIEVNVNGKKLLPGHHETKSYEDIIGFDGSIKVIADPFNPSNETRLYRLMCLYSDNRCFSVFYDKEGVMVGAEWE